jgi:peptidoglycan hydrolase CwlO-like protein
VDLIIEVLREHERIFDTLLNHLDTSIDRMDIKRIEVMLEKENLENEKIEVLVEKIAELENQIDRYKSRIEEIESIPASLKNRSQ